HRIGQRCCRHRPCLIAKLLRVLGPSQVVSKGWPVNAGLLSHVSFGGIPCSTFNKLDEGSFPLTSNRAHRIPNRSRSFAPSRAVKYHHDTAWWDHGRTS